MSDDNHADLARKAMAEDEHEPPTYDGGMVMVAWVTAAAVIVIFAVLLWVALS